MAFSSILIETIIFFCLFLQIRKRIQQQKENIMIKKEIGTNAGRIWEFLNIKGEMPITEIKKKLKLKEFDLHIALGWLAREDKIFFHVKEDGIWVDLW